MDYVMNTRELIARQYFTGLVRSNWVITKARIAVFNKLGIVLPYQEAKKLFNEALILNSEVL